MTRHTSQRLAFIVMLAAIVLSPLAATLASFQQELPMPTMDDLNKMYEAKEYRTCLQQIARVMRQAGQGGNNRYALLLLRADCLLQLQDGATARNAYTAAQKSPDLDQAAEAYAMSFLISKSPGMKYTPSDGSPISILDRADRKRAMLALLNDQLDSSGNEIRRALTAQTIDPILQVWPKMRSLMALELTATGKTERVEPLFRELGQSARGVLDRQLGIMNDRLQQIENQSAQPGGSTMVQSGGVWWADPGIVRKGLTPDDRQLLRQIIDYCPQITEQAEHGLRIATRLGGQPQAWQDVIDKAQQIQQRASSILDTE